MTEVNNAAMASNNLFAFSGVPIQRRNDIQDLLLYADHRATQIWRPASQWTSWINYYRSELTRSGCQLKSQIVRQPLVINSARELEGLSVDITGSVRVSGLMSLAQRSFNATGFKDQARQFFESGLASGYFRHFQIVPCISGGADDVLILICGLHASASVSVESRGGARWQSREMVVRLAGGVYSLSGEALAPHRQRIQARLRELGQFNLKHLSI